MADIEEQILKRVLERLRGDHDLDTAVIDAVRSLMDSGDAVTADRLVSAFEQQIGEVRR